MQCERGREGGRGTIKTRWVAELAEQYGAFFDMCRSERLAVRVCFFVELCGSLLLGCVAGWRPTSGSCSGVAALMLVVATALFLYEVVLLPYRCVRDNAFGVIMGALQVAQCVCALLLTLDWMTSKVLLGWMALCQSCSLIFQLCLTLAWCRCCGLGASLPLRWTPPPSRAHPSSTCRSSHGHRPQATIHLPQTMA